MKVRKGGSEEIPLVQGKEQRLSFAGTAVKIKTNTATLKAKRSDSLEMLMARVTQGPV